MMIVKDKPRPEIDCVSETSATWSYSIHRPAWPVGVADVPETTPGTAAISWIRLPAFSFSIVAVPYHCIIMRCPVHCLAGPKGSLDFARQFAERPSQHTHIAVTRPVTRPIVETREALSGSYDSRRRRQTFFRSRLKFIWRTSVMPSSAMFREISSCISWIAWLTPASPA